MKTSAGKRVLMLLENAPYPQDSRPRWEAEVLTAAGYRVSVICPAARGQPWRESIHGVQVYRYLAPLESYGTVGFILEFGYAMLATFLLSLYLWLVEGFDIVHAHCPPDTFVLLGAFYKLLGKRFVYDHHDLSPELYRVRLGGQGRQPMFPILVLLEKLSCRLADHVLATNESYKEIEMLRGGIPASRITVVRNGPEPDCMMPAEPDVDLRRKASTIIGYAGVIAPQDGVDYLLRALQHLRCQLGRTDFFCVIVGAGPALSSLKALTEQLDLTEHILFTGWVTPKELARYLSAADICVAPEPSNPYNDRSTAIKVMEYMALGKPTVAFDLPEHRLTAQDAAVYARPNDELDLARQIAALMDDPQWRKRMGQAGRRRVEMELVWSHQEKHLLEAYNVLKTTHQGSIQHLDAGSSA